MFRKDYLAFYQGLKEDNKKFDPLEESLLDRIKEQKCKFCECNINVPADVLCDDCPHMKSKIPRKNEHMRESFSTPEERKTRKEALDKAAQARNAFICAACGKEYHKHYEWPIKEGHSHCIDCVKTTVEVHSVLADKTGLANIMKHMNKNRILLTKSVTMEEVNTDEKIDAVRDSLFNDLTDVLKRYMTQGFYSEYKHTNWPDKKGIDCCLDYFVLTPQQYKRLMALAFEKDHFTDERLLEDWLKKEKYKTDLTESVEKQL